MSNSSRLLTTAAPWRRVCAVLAAVALIGGGIASSAPAAPARDTKVVVVSSDSPAILVPDIALVMTPRTQSVPTGLARISAEPYAVAALVVSAGTGPDSSTPVTLDSTGIPGRALEAYREAASLTDSADSACHVDWALLAAIGRVESNHGRFGGNQLDLAGVAKPGIIGIPLDGSNGTALITDSDGGRLDRDTTYDRAVGPMQFIPSTWRVAGTDADGDGVKNPQDMADAAAATAVYLCSGAGDLSTPGDLRAAIMRYNASDSYARMVTAIADEYRHGVTALPPSVLPPSVLPPSVLPASVLPASVLPRVVSATPATMAVKIAAATPAPGSTPITAPGQQPAVSLGAPAPVPVTLAPVTLAPVTPGPVTPGPVTLAPVTLAPVTLAPVTPAPVTPAPVTPAPVTPAPVTPAPVTPVPVTPAPVTPAPVTPAPVPAAPVPVTPVPVTPALTV